MSVVDIVMQILFNVFNINSDKNNAFSIKIELFSIVNILKMVI